MRTGASASCFPISARFWSAPPTFASTIRKPCAARRTERDYILQSLAFVLPTIKVRPDEIVFQFSGVRPLPASKDSFTGRIPRDHYLYLRRDRRCRAAGLMHDRWQMDDLPLLRRAGCRSCARTTGSASPCGHGRSGDWWRPGFSRRPGSLDCAGRRRPAVPCADARRRRSSSAMARMPSASPPSSLPRPTLRFRMPDYSTREIQFLIRSENGRTTRRPLASAHDPGDHRRAFARNDGRRARIARGRKALASWPARRCERARFLTLLLERHGVDEDMLSARNEQRSALCETTARSG